MRALIAALLVTAAAAPALAAEPGEQDRRSPAVERVQEAREQRAQQRIERREAQRERVQQRVRSVRNDAAGDNGVLRVERPERLQRAPRSSARVMVQAPEAEQRQQQRPAERRANRIKWIEAPKAGITDTVAGWRARERRLDSVSPARQGPLAPTARSRSTTPTQRIARGGIQEQVGGQLRRSGVAAALADPAFARRWREDWRRDRNHDWRRHRDRNRSLFRFGFYYDPFGYHYRRFGPGYTIWPTYYSSRYWLHDPWQYRLPYVGGSYRWVRYWDDAVLVDLRTGRVVDVIYDFFW